MKWCASSIVTSLDCLPLCTKRLDARAVYFLPTGTRNSEHEVLVAEKGAGLFERGFARAQHRPGFVLISSVSIVQNPAHRCICRILSRRRSRRLFCFATEGKQAHQPAARLANDSGVLLHFHLHARRGRQLQQCRVLAFAQLRE